MKLQGNKWYYHPKHGADLKFREDEKKHYADGWYDTPDDFPKKSVKKEEKVVGKTEESVNKLAVGDMTKSELEKFAREEYGVELDRRKTHANMIKDLDVALQGHYG